MGFSLLRSGPSLYSSRRFDMDVELCGFVRCCTPAEVGPLIGGCQATSFAIARTVEGISRVAVEPLAASQSRQVSMATRDESCVQIGRQSATEVAGKRDPARDIL